jgi:hypothetical protein
MTQSFAILTKINRPVFPTLIVHVDAPSAAEALLLVMQGYPDADIRGLVPHAAGRMV